MPCGMSVIFDSRHPASPVRTVTMLFMRTKRMECCVKRDDLWGSEVINRLHGCIDLDAAESVYHDNF